MKLAISVVITSSAPERTRNRPGQSAHSAPPETPAMKQSGKTIAAG